MRGRMFVIVGVLLALAVGCAKSPDTGQKPVESLPDSPALTDTERAEFNLPLPDVLTLATSEDIANAKSVSKAVRAVVGDYIKKEHRGVKWEISATRDIKGHILLWLNFPNIRDGGVDVIYSKDKKAIVDTFLGGYGG
jgi:hypothetical protein